MGDLIKPNLKIVSKDGEFKLHLVIDLNINFTTNNMSVVAKLPDEVEKEVEDKVEKDNIWAIPEFKSVEKIKFGKKKED